MKPALVLAFVIILNGCMVVVEGTPHPSPDMRQSVSVRPWVRDNDPAPPVTLQSEVTPTPAPRTEVPVCAPFQLPLPRPVPDLEDLRNPEITTQAQVETVLANHINELLAHIRTERQRLEDAHQAYLARCRP